MNYTLVKRSGHGALGIGISYSSPCYPAPFVYSRLVLTLILFNHRECDRKKAGALHHRKIYSPSLTSQKAMPMAGYAYAKTHHNVLCQIN